ncbi:hypothetical protein [Microbulbifer spongiae]|uniref:Uncharacterized protein n=1 Tax=Microbulbifer spongiae TaxID=2944933 RepID=A0ABY9EHA7_9GAMM|nr:hypothetical protein [Microbulbifer sp. MI-G]WKD51543.1 hypothetical protein M8T91_09020 [Microbulbifer sp. MI-G]
MKKKFTRRKRGAAALLFGAFISTGLFIWAVRVELFFSPNSVTMLLDQEERHNNAPLSGSTQSINRFYSKLRKLDKITPNFNSDTKKLELTVASSSDPSKKEEVVFFEEIESRFLTPLLPYARAEKLSEFDSFNLMLAEYARNGVSLSRQHSNKVLGSFHGGRDFFDPFAQEYNYKEGIIGPNENVTPKRMSIINNCLSPGLWEINAQDSVGEMYHGWFSMPKDQYFSMIRVNNDLKVSDLKLRFALRYNKNAEVLLELERLRKEIKTLYAGKAQLASNKVIGSYSSQDSRRKVQRQFFNIKRDGEIINAKYFSDLRSGDIFELYAFIPPGIYSTEKLQTITYNPDWQEIEIREVQPLTQFKGNQSQFDDMGYIELVLYSSDRSHAFIIGNIPIALLVMQEDYDIPALGVGVLPASEPIERRYLRFKEGPSPHYAYMARIKEGKFYGVNNHEYGIEQIYLRPFEKEGSPFLRITFVSYERIMDVLEVEVPLNELVFDRIRLASNNYRRPLFRTYLDSNIL